MPYTEKQRKMFNARADSDPEMAKLAHEANQMKKEGKELPKHKGASHNDKYDEGMSGEKHEAPEQKAKGGGEKAEKPSARGHLAGKAEGGNSHKGSAYAEQDGVPDGGDISGNEHSGDASVAHTHHHEDIHVHLHAPVSAADATSAMHQNPHSGFGRPPPAAGGVVPMYSATQSGVTMNDSHPAGGAGLGSDKGRAANGGVKGKSNPVKKGRS